MFVLFLFALPKTVVAEAAHRMEEMDAFSLGSMALEQFKDPIYTMGEAVTNMVLDQYGVPDDQKDGVKKMLKFAIEFKTRTENGDCYPLQVEMKDLLRIVNEVVVKGIEMSLDIRLDELSPLEIAWAEWIKDYFMPWFRNAGYNYIEGPLCEKIHEGACALLNQNEARCDAAPKCEWDGSTSKCVVFTNQEQGFEESTESEEL